MGAGNAWASHKTLNIVPDFISKESDLDFADLGNFGGT